MTRLIALLLAILFALGLLSVSQASAEECGQAVPVQQGRWTVVDPCYRFEGWVDAYGSSSNGAYWLFLSGVNGGGVSAKVYPNTGIPRPAPWERVIVTGPLVTEVSDASGTLTAAIRWIEIVPVVKLERPDLEREYPELRANGRVYVVQQWRDGTYSSWPADWFAVE